MKVVVDFDGTLSLGNSSHIQGSEPNYELIGRLQKLKSLMGDSCEIKIVTARGAKDGLSEEEKIRKYANLIENFCKKYNVPYDSISFNKEYANLYIDDMTISQNESFYGLISPHTKNNIIFTGQSVIKKTDTATQEKDWYSKASIIIKCPEVLFSNNDCIITSIINNPNKIIEPSKYISILARLGEFKKTDYKFNTYVDYVFDEAVKYNSHLTESVYRCIACLTPHQGTFNHGDFSCENIIEDSSTGEVYVIDSNNRFIFGSNLIDAGKLYFSLIAYQKDYNKANQIAEYFGREDVMAFAVSEGVRVLKKNIGYASIVNNIADSLTDV
jgi:hypothetical protein